jgi:hypothetical protein
VHLQPYEVLRVGMKREFVVVDEEDEYGQTILSLAAAEVRWCAASAVSEGAFVCHWHALIVYHPIYS